MEVPFWYLVGTVITSFLLISDQLGKAEKEGQKKKIEWGGTFGASLMWPVMLPYFLYLKLKEKE